MIKQSFVLRIFAISILTIAFPLLIDTCLFFNEVYRESIRDAKKSLDVATNVRTLSLRELSPVKQIFLEELIVLMDLPKVLKKLPDKAVDQQLEDIATLVGRIEIFILKLPEEANYTILASSSAEEIRTIFTSVQLGEILQSKESVFFRYHYSLDKKKIVPYFFIAQAINDPETHETRGILMIAVDVEDQLENFLAPKGKIAFALLSRDEIVFAASDRTLIGQLFAPVALARMERIRTLKQFGDYPLGEKPLLTIPDEENPSFFEFFFDGQLRIAYKAPLPESPAYLISYSSKEKIFAAAITHFIIIYSIYGLILMGGGAVAYWLSKWFGRPLQQLSHLMGKVRQGDYNVRFHPEPLGFEINTLGLIFNQTLEALLEHIQKAEDERVKRERYEKELIIGQEVQRNLLLPSLPSLEGTDIAAVYLPAREVGGDFYDFYIKLAKPKKLIMTIADASGKGVSACLYALGVRSMLRAYASIYEDVAVMLSKTNNLFIQDAGNSGMYVTALMGSYDPETHLFSYYSFGHPPGILRRADGQLVYLEHAGMALGLVETGALRANTVELKPGDAVIFYTNGVIDAINEKNQEFSHNRLKQILQTRRWLTASQIAEGIGKEIKEFIGTVRQEDDITILVLQIR